MKLKWIILFGQENFPKNIYIDNDYGLIRSVSDFVNQGAIYADLTVSKKAESKEKYDRIRITEGRGRNIY